MSGLAILKEAPGLTAFLDELEERLAAIVSRSEGVVATIGGDALASGGKRLRPALCFLSSPVGSPPPFAAAASVELLHMATLVHDDVLDRAELRRGRPTVFASAGREAATATGDLLFSRAFAELIQPGAEEAVRAAGSRPGACSPRPAGSERCSEVAPTWPARSAASAHASDSPSRCSTTCSTYRGRPSGPASRAARTCSTAR
jgi:hypothetical protein